MPSPRSFKFGNIFTVAVFCAALAAGPTLSRGAETDLEKEYIAAGIFETGLTLEMPKKAKCPEMTLGFASRLNRSGRMRSKRHGAYHAGVDWALPEGTPILAVADGQVIDRDEELHKSRGKFVVIEHGSPHDGLYSSYVHLSGFNVNSNQAVKKGQVIGFVGKTGKGATYIHLHLNIFGKETIRVGNRKWKYRYDYLQLLSGDMSPIDPARKRQQKVKVAYMDQDGKVHPTGAKVIWPFACERKIN
ncbi:MAG TPA: M23 family metallopeptidase [Rhodospirillales bacterium]|jgi:murein DD-endopeptidase MepM/ murein hydrolase activator NlpD|nr:M23 family metallopeptidase [Rhodospirillales bacterium]